MADNLLLPITLERILDSDGNPVSGAKVNVYDAGTTNFKSVFTDNDLTVAGANPIIADSAGYVSAHFIGTGDYKLVITDSSDVTIKTEDNLTGALDTSSFSNDTALPTTPIVVKSSNYTVLTTDRSKVIHADATGGNITITLLDATTAGDNFRITVKHIGSANEVSVATTGGDTLDGSSSFLLDAQYESITCVSDGANWSIATDARIQTDPIPTGTVVPYAGTTAPSGWLFCDGAAVSRTGNSALFTVLGTTYGAGDGSTTFNVPDMGGRVPAGKETTATRLTSGAGGVDGGTLAATGGDQTHTLTEAQLPAHAHNMTISSRVFNTGGSSDDNRLSRANTGGSAVTTNVGDTADTGSGNAHANVQPTIVLNYIIKT